MDSDIENFRLWQDGVQVVRGFLDGVAVSRALAIVEPARAKARTALSIDAQRVQPLRRYLDPDALRELCDVAMLDRIRVELEVMVGPGIDIDHELFGLWIEPARRSYVLPWHRDLRDNAKGLDWKAWYGLLENPRYFNQFHIALYDDDSLWIVPGSHRRDDTPEEMRLCPTRPILVDFIERELDPWYDGADKYPPRNAIDRAVGLFDRYYYGRWRLPVRPDMRRRNVRVEHLAEDYCRSMPSARKVALNAGDLMVYRNSAWHTAIYRADRPRATLFSNAATAESYAWVRGQRDLIREKGAAVRWFSRDQLD